MAESGQRGELAGELEADFGRSWGGVRASFEWSLGGFRAEVEQALGRLEAESGLGRACGSFKAEFRRNLVGLNGTEIILDFCWKRIARKGIAWPWPWT